MYEEVEERQSRIVPILTIVAALLAVAIGVVVVLFVTGVFDRSTKPATPVAESAGATAAAPAEATQAAPTAVETAPTVATPGTTTAESTDVPKATVSIAPPGQGEPRGEVPRGNRAQFLREIGRAHV